MNGCGIDGGASWNDLVKSILRKILDAVAFLMLRCGKCVPEASGVLTAMK